MCLEIWMPSFGKTMGLPGTVMVYACHLRGMRNGTTSFTLQSHPGRMVSDMVTYPEGSGNAVEEAVARRGGVRRTLAPLYDVGAWAQTNTSQNIDGFTPTFKITIS